MNPPLLRSNDPNGSIWGRVNDRRKADLAFDGPDRRVIQTYCEDCGTDRFDPAHDGPHGTCSWVQWSHREAQMRLPDVAA